MHSMLNLQVCGQNSDRVTLNNKSCHISSRRLKKGLLDKCLKILYFIKHTTSKNYCGMTNIGHFWYNRKRLFYVIKQTKILQSFFMLKPIFHFANTNHVSPLFLNSFFLSLYLFVNCSFNLYLCVSYCLSMSAGCNIIHPLTGPEPCNNHAIIT